MKLYLFGRSYFEKLYIIYFGMPLVVIVSNVNLDNINLYLYSNHGNPNKEKKEHLTSQCQNR